MTPRYERLPESEHQWCSVHRRVATHVLIRDGCESPELNPPEHCCDPALGGIMLPCKCHSMQPNQDWVEPKDGEIVEVWMSAEGAKKAVYNAKTKSVEWSPFTVEDCME